MTQSLDEFDPPIGIPEELEPGLRRIVAPNPSPMTYRGTNTYLLGASDLAVIDPGPNDPAHLDAILGALAPDQRISHIIVTHAHLDHSPLAAPLSAATGADIWAFGDASSGRSKIMTEIAKTGMVGGGEGVDASFAPTRIVQHQDRIEGRDWSLEVLHTPGHFGNHISLAWQDACFTADHVMGWASSLVSPPDGDLTDFMASCDLLQNRKWRVFHPGHGAPIADPAARLDWLIAHRNEREAAVLDHLARSPATATELATLIYTETPPALLSAATRNVFAHLVDLMGKDRVTPTDGLHSEAKFQLISN